MPAAQTVLAKAYLVSNTSNPLGKALPRVVGLGRNLVGAAGLKMHGACLSHTHDACMVRVSLILTMVCVTLILTIVCVTLIHTMVCVSRWFVSHNGLCLTHSLT